MSDESAIELSVVIVTFANAGEIQSCIDALLAAIGNRRFEIFVIDNASPDDTQTILTEISHNADLSNGSLELTCNPSNVGFTRALNQGLRQTHGNYILTLNPDTGIQKSSLETLLQTLRENETVGVVAPQLLNFDGSIQPSCRRFPLRRDLFLELIGLSRAFPTSEIFNHWKMGDFDHRETRVVDQPQGACLFFRRRVLEQVGLWDERFPMFFSDVDWCRRVKSAGCEIVFECRAKVVHLRGISVKRRRAAMIWSSHLSFYQYFKKYHRGFFNQILNEGVGMLLIVSAMFRIAWNILSGGVSNGR